MFSQVLTTLHARHVALCHKLINSITSRPGDKLSTLFPLKRNFRLNLGPTPRKMRNHFTNSFIPTSSTPFPKIIVLFIITTIVIQMIIFIIIIITIIFFNVIVIVNAIITIFILIFVVVVVLTGENKTSCSCWLWCYPRANKPP